MEDSAVSIKHTSTIQTKMCATIVTNILLYSVNKEVWEILRMNVQGKHYTWVAKATTAFVNQGRHCAFPQCIFLQEEL